MLGALGYWGFETGDGAATQALLGVGAPVAAAVVWGLFIAPKASHPVPQARSGSACRWSCSAPPRSASPPSPRRQLAVLFVVAVVAARRGDGRARPQGSTTALSASPLRWAASAAPVSLEREAMGDDLERPDRAAGEQGERGAHVGRAGRPARGDVELAHEDRVAVDRQRAARAAAARRRTARRRARAPRRRPRSPRRAGCRRSRRRPARCRGRSRPSARRARAARAAARAPTRPRRRSRARRRCGAGRCSPRRPRARRRPASTPARRWARSAQASGSVKVASTGSMPSSGSSSPTSSGWMRTYSAKPPGSSRVERKRSHSVSWPRRQRRHSPHGAWWWIATRSPTAHAVDARADLDHLAGRLVAEHGGQLAADVERLHVGAAGRAGQHAAHDLAGAGDRVGRLLEDRLVLGERASDPHLCRARRGHPARW